MRLKFEELLEMFFHIRFGEQQEAYEHESVKTILNLLLSLYHDYHLTPSAVLQNFQDKDISKPEKFLYELLKFRSFLDFIYE